MRTDFSESERIAMVERMLECIGEVALAFSALSIVYFITKVIGL